VASRRRFLGTTLKRFRIVGQTVVLFVVIALLRVASRAPGLWQRPAGARGKSTSEAAIGCKTQTRNDTGVSGTIKSARGIRVCNGSRTRGQELRNVEDIASTPRSERRRA
jgi:hypothetical protein